MDQEKWELYQELKDKKSKAIASYIVMEGKPLKYGPAEYEVLAQRYFRILQTRSAEKAAASAKPPTWQQNHEPSEIKEKRKQDHRDLARQRERERIKDAIDNAPVIKWDSARGNEFYNSVSERDVETVRESFTGVWFTQKGERRTLSPELRYFIITCTSPAITVARAFGLRSCHVGHIRIDYTLKKTFIDPITSTAHAVPYWYR